MQDLCSAYGSSVAARGMFDAPCGIYSCGMVICFAACMIFSFSMQDPLVVVRGIFVVVCRIFCCSMWDLQLFTHSMQDLSVGACGIFSCDMWDHCCSLWDDFVVTYRIHYLWYAGYLLQYEESLLHCVGSSVV